MTTLEHGIDADGLRIAERLACIRDACPLCALGHDVVYSWELRERRPRLGAWAGLGHQTAAQVEPCRAARIWVRHAAEGLPALGASLASREAALVAFQFQEHERALGDPGTCLRFPGPTGKAPQGESGP